MTESDWIMLIALVEAVLLMGLALAVIALVARRRNRRDRAAADTLAGRIKDGGAARRDALTERLTEQRGLDSEQAEAAAGDILAAEEGFVRNLLRTYIRRDAARLARMDKSIHHLGEAYERIPLPEAADTVDDGADADASEADDARAASGDGERLEEDLQLYKDALNRVFAEYTAMFGTRIDHGGQLSATEILERLETGELGGRPADSEVEQQDPGNDRSPAPPDDDPDVEALLKGQ
ncbi:hypothetical protein H0Z60_08965 [Ectothiorhodospiraceae bacterium WFHF3C12]|nr:hypothetical protein [Ectothiorhodospiraceae bacterium WFHF3C12]